MRVGIKSSTLHGRKQRYMLLLMALPFIVWIFMFKYMPLFGWIYSLYEYKPGVPLSRTPFVGLKFYQMILLQDSREVIRVVRNTLVLFFLHGVILAPLPMVFAIMLNEIRHDRFRKLIQSLTTLPHFISWVIVFSFAFVLFSYDGLLNQVLLRFGWIDRPFSVLADNNAVYWFQTSVSMWKGIGWSAIVYLAAIAGIDPQLYDAAQVDGAGRFRSIWHITIPGVMPTFVVLLVLGIGFALSGFDQYFVFRNNITADHVETVDVYVYRVGMVMRDFPYSTAVGIAKTFVSIVLVTAANLMAKWLRGSTVI